MFPDNNSSHSFFDFPLTANELFAHLSADERRHLDALKEKRHFEKDQIIFDLNERPPHIFFLRCGGVALLHKDREPDTFATCPPRSERIFGVIETLSDSPFYASLITTTPCDADVMQRDTFLSLLVEHPRLCFQLARLVSSRYQHTMQLISSL